MNDTIMADDELDAASKIEAPGDQTPSSISSSPEPDANAEASEPAKPQKRKGGRKPIYATTEERKQRNRQAQAAFRERRTEYIKQLESSLKQHQDQLTQAREEKQHMHNEVLMLRYKNSLLERILLEKGIDVQAELSLKQGGGLSMGMNFGQPFSAANQGQMSQLPKAGLQRSQHRLSGGRSYLPKLAPGQGAAELGFVSSPHAHPTPSSHASSPSQLSTRSPMAVQQGAVTSPAANVLAQPNGQQFQHFSRPSQQQPNAGLPPGQALPPTNAQRSAQRPPVQHANFANGAGIGSNSTATAHQAVGPALSSNTLSSLANSNQPATAFYPSPFQKHYDQLGKFLDQEYDTQHSRSILEEPELDNPAIGASADDLDSAYAQHFGGNAHQPGDYYQAPGVEPQMAPSGQYDQGNSMPPTSHPAAMNAQFEIDPNDPRLDQDPFGLSASMHYPTSYSFDQHHDQR